MGEQNKLVKGMLYGAVLGAAISLLDRQTREKTVLQIKDCSRKVWVYSKNPSVLIDNVSNKLSATRQKVEEVTDDLAFIVEKVNDIKQSGNRLLMTNKNVEDGDGRG